MLTIFCDVVAVRVPASSGMIHHSQHHHHRRREYLVLVIFTVIAWQNIHVRVRR